MGVSFGQIWFCLPYAVAVVLFLIDINSGRKGSDRLRRAIVLPLGRAAAFSGRVGCR